MNVYEGFPHFDTPSVVVVGSFDGVHSGHRRLIAEVNAMADRLAYRAVVVTFDPHPRQVLRGENRLLTTIEERKILLEQAGVRDLVVVNFTREFAAVDGDSFVRDYLKEKLCAKAVFTGEGHSFGKNRSGDQEILHRHNIITYQVERYDQISSTRIREAVDGGQMELASQLLGAHYMIVAPISDTTKLLPAEGRYLCSMDGQEVELSTSELTAIEKPSRVLVKKRL